MNKHTHRVVFNKARGAYVAVAETTRAQGKASKSVSVGVCHSALATLAMGLTAAAAMAGPQGGVVAAGSASISQSGNLTQIHQTSQNAIVNWNSFSVNNAQTVQFLAPNAQAAILNRVTGNLPSQIDGTLLGNGRVFLINQNGIVLGKDGLINVNGGFVASTQNVTDAAFMSGNPNFSGGDTGAIQVLGRISAPGGDIVLIAPKTEVAASASLSAGANIQLIAASDVSFSNGKYTVIPMAANAGQITIAGALEAANIQLKAVNNNLAALAINTTGTLRATGTQVHPDGVISLLAVGRQGAVTQLEGASLVAKNADGSGGSVQVLGETVQILGASSIDASANLGSGGQGGTVLVGGDYQGRNADVHNATTTRVGAQASIHADGDQSGTGQGGTGNGGKVIVWANDHADYEGRISARGGAQGGDGGFVEVSGKNTLNFAGTADTSAARGQTGTLLLDPTDISIIAAGPDANITGNPNFTGTANTSVISTATLINALNTNNVVVDTTSPHAGVGNIVVNAHVSAPLTWSSANNLTLRAHNNIVFSGSGSPITATGAGSLTVLADQDNNGTGNVSFNHFIRTTGGNITVQGANIMTSGSGVFDSNYLSGAANAGNISMTATHGSINLVQTSNQTIYANGAPAASSGIAGGNGGNITLSAQTGISLAGYAVARGGSAFGGNASGGRGGNVTLLNATSGNISSALFGIETQSGDATGNGGGSAAGSIVINNQAARVSGAGGDINFGNAGVQLNAPGGVMGRGGDVTLTSANGAILGRLIHVNGGAGNTGFAGADAGTVTISGATVDLNLGNWPSIRANGGAGSAMVSGTGFAGGNSGLVSITSLGTLRTSEISSVTGNSTGAATVTTTANRIELTGGSITGTGTLNTTGGTNNNAGNILVTASGGIAGLGPITASGGAGNTGAVGANAGTVTISGATVDITGAITANGGAGSAVVAGTGFAGGHSGSVRITSTGTLRTGAITSSSGNSTGLATVAPTSGNPRIELTGGSITGTGALTTSGGTNNDAEEIHVTSTNGGIAGLGGIAANGGSAATTTGSGGDGGLVLVSGRGGLVSLAGISTNGAVSSAGTSLAGGIAGTVTVVSNAGISLTGALSSSGAAGSAPGGSGGQAGVIRLHNGIDENGSPITGGATGDITSTAVGTVTVSGGNGVANGTGGQPGSIVVNNQATNGSVNLLGAINTFGGTNGAGGTVSLTSAQGGVSVNTISASGGATQSGGDVTISAAQDVVVDRTITTRGGASTTAAGSVGGSGGRVTITSSNGSIVSNASRAGAAATFAIQADGGAANGSASTAGLGGSLTMAVDDPTKTISLFGRYDVSGGGAATAGSTPSAGGSMTFNGNVLVSGFSIAPTTVDFLATGGNATLANAAAGGNVTFNGTLNANALYAAPNLTVTTSRTGQQTYNGAVGGVTPLASFTANNLPLNSTGAVNINGGSFITTGAQTYNSNVNLGANTVMRTTGGNVSFNRMVDATGNTLTLDTGAGNVTGTNTDNDFNRVNFTSAGVVSLVDKNNLNVGGGNVGSVLARTLNGGHITLSGNLTATAAGTGAITLAADGNFLNAANHALTTSHATGNWRVYSTDPRLDTRGTAVLAGYGFKQYNTAYGGAINGAATGNGLIYKVNPTASAALSGTAIRQYNGTVNASLTNLSISGGVGIDGDTVNLGGAGTIVPGSATYDTKHVGTGKTVTANTSGGFTVTGASNSSQGPARPVYGYTSVSTTAVGNVGQITQAPLTVAAQTHTRGYDGTSSSSVAPVLSGTVFASDSVSTAATQSFATRNVGTGITLTASGLVIDDGNGGANYNVTYVPDATGVITPAVLTVTAQTDTRVYNGTTSSSVAPVLSGTVFASDSVSTAATQSFATRNVGTGITLTASGLVIDDGNGGANYNVTYVPDATGVITPAVLMVTARSHTRTFNGNTSSSLIPLVTGLFTGDSVVTQATQTFDTPDVGTGKTLTAAGLVIDDGNLGGNYTVNYVSVNTGEITPVPPPPPPLPTPPPTPTPTVTPAPTFAPVLAPTVVPPVPKSVVVTTLVCESGNGIDLQHRDDVKSPRNNARLAERSTGQSAGCKPWTPLPQVGQPATPDAAPSLALPAVTTGMVDVLTAVYNLKTPTLLFDFDSAVISVKGKNYLDMLSKILRTAPDKIDRIEIKGHTDSIGPLAVNQALSQNRANAVKNYLIRQGIKNAILTKGMADKEPLQICADRDGACRQNQRRVEIKVFFSTGKPENFSQLQSK